MVVQDFIAAVLIIQIPGPTIVLQDPLDQDALVAVEEIAGGGLAQRAARVIHLIATVARSAPC